MDNTRRCPCFLTLKIGDKGLVVGNKAVEEGVMISAFQHLCMRLQQVLLGLTGIHLILNLLALVFLLQEMNGTMA
eukprot:13675603-Ditylum_brightwellii.AAC.1